MIAMEPIFSINGKLVVVSSGRIFKDEIQLYIQERNLTTSLKLIIKFKLYNPEINQITRLTYSLRDRKKGNIKIIINKTTKKV